LANPVQNLVPRRLHRAWPPVKELDRFLADGKAGNGYKRIHLKGSSPGLNGGAGEREQDTAERFLVLIECKIEKHREQVLAECQRRGWKCKPLMG